MSVNFEDLYEEFLLFSDNSPSSSAFSAVGQLSRPNSPVSIFEEDFDMSQAPPPSSGTAVSTPGDSNYPQVQQHSQTLNNNHPHHQQMHHHQQQHQINPSYYALPISLGYHQHPPTHIHHHLPPTPISVANGTHMGQHLGQGQSNGHPNYFQDSFHQQNPVQQGQSHTGPPQGYMQMSNQQQMHQSLSSVSPALVNPVRNQWQSCSGSSGGMSLDVANAMFPGGLEILWRELPVECQRLISQQDVPETARFRGYFTVCELLTLKRALLARYNPNSQAPPPPGHQGQGQHRSRPQEEEDEGHYHNVKRQRRVPSEQVSSGNLILSNLGPEMDRTTNTTAATGDSEREKSPTLIDLDNQNKNCSGGSSSTSREKVTPKQGSPQYADQKEEVEPKIVKVTGKESPPKIELVQRGSPEKRAAEEEPASAKKVCVPSNKSNDHQQQQGQSNGEGQGQITPQKSSKTTINLQNNPPFRTATLVFKLLQIGNYNFRTFSDSNPNKLRIIFNSQRISYECQLPMVQPPRDSLQPLRKLLMVDISFDQITMIRFGPDKLFLRVDGPPLLTVTYNPSNEPYSGPPPLTTQDLNLLEQIDKGQLKLNPYHQLYFLNERLVNLLECQFKEHPRFKNLMDTSISKNSN